jgi:hypothetical protein
MKHPEARVNTQPHTAVSMLNLIQFNIQEKQQSIVKTD